MNRNALVAERLSRLAAAAVILVGLLVLAGWVFDIEPLKTIVPQTISMKINTAVCFVLVGIALLLPRSDDNAPCASNPAAWIGGFVALTGLATLAQDIVGVDFGIDGVLYREPAGAVETTHPGRMAPTTSIDFFLLGLAMLALCARRFWLSQIMATVALLTALFAIVGYVYDVRPLYGVTAANPIAVNTAIAFLLLAVAVLCSQPSRGLMALVTNDTVGGDAVRRLLPIAFFLPIAFGWLIMIGGEAGLYGERFGIALFALSMTVALMLILLIFGHSLRVADERRCRLEEERERATVLLAAANKELEAFSYSVSHDLRSPLRAIDGYSRIIEENDGGRLDDKGRRLLAAIRTNTQTMSQLIDDLLSFSHMGRKELVMETIEMTDLVRSVANNVVTADRRIDVAIAPLPAARADRAMVRQVWTNLIANAIKFTRTKGDAMVEISGTVVNGTVEYAIKDNGVGFDMRYADKLFGVFQRLHHMEEFEGTGIGLAIVQRIVCRHGGSVRAEGIVNEGATIRFSLPQ